MRLLAVIPLTFALVIAGCGGNSSTVSVTPSNPGANPGTDPGSGNNPGTGGNNPGNGGNNPGNGGSVPGNPPYTPQPLCALPNSNLIDTQLGAIGSAANYDIDQYTHIPPTGGDFTGTWVVISNTNIQDYDNGIVTRQKRFFVIKNQTSAPNKLDVSNCDGRVLTEEISNQVHVIVRERDLEDQIIIRDEFDRDVLGTRWLPWADYITIKETAVDPDSDNELENSYKSYYLPLPLETGMGASNGMRFFVINNELVPESSNVKIKRISTNTSNLGSISASLGTQAFTNEAVSCVVQTQFIDKQCPSNIEQVSSIIEVTATNFQHRIGTINTDALIIQTLTTSNAGEHYSEDVDAEGNLISPGPHSFGIDPTTNYSIHYSINAATISNDSAAVDISITETSGAEEISFDGSVQINTQIP